MSVSPSGKVWLWYVLCSVLAAGLGVAGAWRLSQERSVRAVRMALWSVWLAGPVFYVAEWVAMSALIARNPPAEHAWLEQTISTTMLTLMVTSIFAVGWTLYLRMSDAVKRRYPAASPGA